MKNTTFKSGHVLALGFTLMTVPALAADESFGPFKYDGGKISCNDDRGPEIQQYETYRAPSDRFFKEGSITVAEISGWGKEHSCSVSEIKRKTIKVHTDYGEIETSVISEFTIYAHADCGSGLANNSGGKTAAVECSVSATTTKYTNK